MIGWQTDNEMGGPVCYCASCLADFRQWLKAKYGSIEALNRAWGLHFWGHKLSTFEHVPFPGDDGAANPSLCLDRRRYQTFANVRFQAEQVQILRELCPRHFVTHNCMGLNPGLNLYEFCADLDFVSFDNYPVWGAPAVPYEAALAADVMRGIKAKNFWIMEQTAGPCGWSSFGRNPRPGEIRTIAYQQLAHGADAQIWFRWRTCTVGREQYWHGLLGHDGRPLRRYQEAKQVAGEYRKLESALAGTSVKADVAMMYDYDSLWALQIQPGYPQASYKESLGRWHAALLRAGVNVDMVAAGADLSKYRLVVAPHLHVMPDAVATKLKEFVDGGGVLVADCRTGVKDKTNLCHARTLPGLLSETLGIEIPEYSALAKEMSYKVLGKAGLSGEWTATHYTDWIESKGAEVLAGYEGWEMEKYAAVTRHRSGKGVGWYVGTIAKESEFYDRVVARLVEDAGVASEIHPPTGVEVSVREGAGKRLVFLINHTEEPRKVEVPAGMTELLSGKKCGGTVELERLAVAVLANETRKHAAKGTKGRRD